MLSGGRNRFASLPLNHTGDLDSLFPSVDGPNVMSFELFSG